MRKPVILITGASGEIGHGLIENLAANEDTSIVTIDLQPLPREHRDLVDREYLGSILVTKISFYFKPNAIFFIFNTMSNTMQ